MDRCPNYWVVRSSLTYTSLATNACYKFRPYWTGGVSRPLSAFNLLLATYCSTKELISLAKTNLFLNCYRNIIQDLIGNLKCFSVQRMKYPVYHNPQIRNATMVLIIAWGAGRGASQSVHQPIQWHSGYDPHDAADWRFPPFPSIWKPPHYEA